MIRRASSLLVLLLLGPVLLEVTTADNTFVLAERLPSGRSGPAAVWANGKAYVVAGHDGSGHISEIVEYDPVVGSVTVVASVPQAMFTPSAVWTGTMIYIFGGSADGGGSGLTDILAFDPLAGSVATVARLPAPTMASSAVWDPRPTPACPVGCVYIFGGSSTISSYSDHVLRFNPSNASVTDMGPVLPIAHRLSSATWAAGYAYVFGGYNGAPLDQIVRYDPLTNTAANMTASLPTGRYGSGAVWSGNDAYVLGGSDDVTDLNEILVYNPILDVVTTSSATFACGVAHAATAWEGTRAYVFGGRKGGPNPGSSNLATIQVYNLLGIGPSTGSC